MTKNRLLGYFERELTYLREKGEIFAQTFPGVAAALDLKKSGTTDPHVERLIESFAFLTARIHQNIDNSSASVSSALLEVLLPHLVRPIPSVAIAQISQDSTRGKASTTHVIPAGSELRSPTLNEQSCVFQTCYDVSLAPAQIVSARLTSPKQNSRLPKGIRSVLSLELAPFGGSSLDEVSFDKIRIYLDGSGQLPFQLYELLLNQPIAVESTASVEINKQSPLSLRAVGMERHEGLLPYASVTPLGQRLLMEYLLFPQKFLFVDLFGLDAHLTNLGKGNLTVHVYSPTALSMWADGVNASCFKLGCTPIVNCFELGAVPIAVDNRHTEYRLIPHQFKQKTMEVYSVTQVKGTSNDTGENVEFRPLYAMDQSSSSSRRDDRLWLSSRRDSHRTLREGSPTDVFLTIVDRRGDAAHLKEDTIRPMVICTNHNLPSRLPFTDKKTVLTMPGKSPGPIHALTRPTPSLRLSLGKDAQWQLVSILAMGNSSLGDPKLATTSLKRLMALLDPTQSAATAQQIEGILSISSTPVSARINAGVGQAMALGLEISIEMDPEAFVGGSPFVLASVLELYFGLQAPLNSFTKTRVRLKNKETVYCKWPPRSGERTLS